MLTLAETVTESLLFAYRQQLTAGLLDDAARTRRLILTLNDEPEED
jgi:hypothetical protein